MRIAVDLTSTPRSKTGIGRYMLGLIKGLQECDSENEYYLFAQDDDLDGFGVYAPNFHMVPVKSRILRKQYIRILWEQFVFPWRLRKIKADVLHCPNFTMPYTKKLIYRRLAVTSAMHDMTYFFLPEFHVGWKREMFKWYIKRTARACDKIITISKNSEADIPRYCKPKNPSVAVTYMGVKEEFFDGGKASEETLSKYGIKGEYIYYVGTLEPRKNVPGLINGYKMLPEEIRNRYSLVITGKKGWLYDEIFETVSSSPELKDRVIFTGYVDDCDMVPIMHSASVFAYVSFYEGFGIPVIEGMASGVPTVTSYGSSLEEISDGHCYLCDPKDPGSISDALASAVRTAEDLKGENGPDAQADASGKIEDAVKRASGFTWKQCGIGSVKAFREAYEKRNGR